MERGKRKTYNKRFKTEVKSSSLTEEEKRELLFQVFDILLAAKKKSFPCQKKRKRRNESNAVTKVIGIDSFSDTGIQ